MKSTIKINNKVDSKLIIAVLLAVILALGLGSYFVFFKKKPQQANFNMVFSFNVFITKLEYIAKHDEFPAKVVPYKMISISSEANGIIAKKHFENGSYVKGGKLIYELESSSFALISSVNYENLKVQKPLFEEKLKNNEISKKEYDDFIKTLTDAEKQNNAVQSASPKIKIFAPASGFLTDSYLPVGMQVFSGQLLGNIIETSILYADIAISSNLFEKIKSDKIDVKIIKDEKEFSSKVISKNLVVNDITDSLMMRVEIQNPKMELLPNMFVEAKVFYPKTKEILIPFNSSIRMPNGMLAVFKVKEDESVEMVFFKEKGVYNQNWVVETGLNEGEMIIHNAVQKMQNGMKIKPQIIEVK
jgi:membrane fusion protein (multidrug efflux system)